MKELSMGYWWNENDEEKLKHFEKNVCQCHFVYNQCHMDWPAIEPEPNLLSHGLALRFTFPQQQT